MRVKHDTGVACIVSVMGSIRRGFNDRRAAAQRVRCPAQGCRRRRSHAVPVRGLLLLVLAGELVVQKEDPAGGMVSLSILREGDIAGEIALLKGLRAEMGLALAFISHARTSATRSGSSSMEQLSLPRDGRGERSLQMHATLKAAPWPHEDVGRRTRTPENVVGEAAGLTR